LVADGIAESFFPVLVGYLYNDISKYSVGFIILICVSLLGVIIISFLPKINKNKTLESFT